MKYSAKWATTILFISSVWVLLIVACSKSPNNNKPISDELIFETPDGWPTPFYNFENNPLTKSNFELGRKLFYEKKLSIDNSVSCGSCHQQFAAFSQFEHNVSHGVMDRVGKRNSPALFNLNWHTSFFWDGGVNHIEVQPINPITDHAEMAETLDGVITKLQQDAEYPKLFAKVYGDGVINSSRMLKAMSLFMGMMVSNQSKYDQYVKGNASLTVDELAGKALYESNCATCHNGPLFTDYSFRSNGLPVIQTSIGTIDSGRAIIDGQLSSTFKFKVPTLRNLKYTVPYMHDGRYTNLAQVLDHYENISPSAFNLDPILSNGIHFSATERTQLLAFLNTLNDEVFVKDKRFAEHP
jgi:cytochrome c peroxidase